jgi:glycerol-3-phosphate dehydrogenase
MYTLANGQTTRVGSGDLSAPQRANMRIDEILRLRDAGAGEIVSQAESPLGLGRYTIRFTLSDGETVDLHTQYPPSTRRQREAIFAETRDLKTKGRFTVHKPQVVPGSGVWGILQYTLADGRAVSHYEQVPTDLITSDGRHIVTPGTGELVEIAGSTRE